MDLNDEIYFNFQIDICSFSEFFYFVMDSDYVFDFEQYQFNKLINLFG